MMFIIDVNPDLKVENTKCFTLDYSIHNFFFKGLSLKKLFWFITTHKEQQLVIVLILTFDISSTTTFKRIETFYFFVNEQLCYFFNVKLNEGLNEAWLKLVFH